MKKFLATMLLGLAVPVIALAQLRVFTTPQGGTGTGSVPSPGQVLVGATGSVYSPAYLTAGSNITIATSSGGITISGHAGTATTTINGVVGPAFTFLTGTSGSNFDLATSTGQITFNLPDASLTARGAVSTSTQTITGEKSLAGDFLPSGSRNIGAAANRWNTGYFSTLDTASLFASNTNIGEATITGLVVSPLLVGGSSTSTITGNGTLSTVGGSLQVKGQVSSTAAQITGNATTTSLTITGATADRLLRTITGGVVQAVTALTDWIAGGTGISVTDDGDGSVTITNTGVTSVTSTPQITVSATTGSAVSFDFATTSVSQFVNDSGYSTSTGANPTASVGLTATNGTANTFMRSDASPALSQAIAPTWTGTHTFSNGTYSALFTGGSVGIGTSTPSVTLEVVGTGIKANGAMIGTSFKDFSDNTYLLDPSNTGNALIVAGRVGIGVTAPTSTLDVVGNISVRTNDSIYLNSAGGTALPFGLKQGGQIADFRESSGATQAGTLIGRNLYFNGTQFVKRNDDDTSYFGTAQGLIFSTVNNSINFVNSPATNGGQDVAVNATTTASRMFINTSGNVGIATTTPTALFHVAQTAAADALRVDDAGGNDTTPFVIDQTGAVGIGAATPVAKAEIVTSGVGKTPLLVLRNTNQSTNDTADIEFRITTGNAMARVSAIRTNELASGDTDLAFDTLSGAGITEKMRIKQNGNVGIGTTNPSSTLHITRTASTTVTIGSASLTGCLVMGDSDGAGLTYVTSLNGVLSATSTKPITCQ